MLVEYLLITHPDALSLCDSYPPCGLFLLGTCEQIFLNLGGGFKDCSNR